MDYQFLVVDSRGDNTEVPVIVNEIIDGIDNGYAFVTLIRKSDEERLFEAGYFYDGVRKRNFYSLTSLLRPMSGAELLLYAMDDNDYNNK